MDEREKASIRAWLLEGSAAETLDELKAENKALKSDLTRAREETDRWKEYTRMEADGRSDTDSALSTTQAELAAAREASVIRAGDTAAVTTYEKLRRERDEARKETEEWKHANGNLHRWAEGLEEGLSNLRARVVEVGGRAARALRWHLDDRNIPLTDVDRDYHAALSNLVKEVESDHGH